MKDYDGQIAAFLVCLVLALVVSVLLFIGGVVGYFYGRLSWRDEIEAVQKQAQEIIRQRDSLQARIDELQIKEWQKEL